MISTHWGFTDLRNGYANIFCPTLHENCVDGFGTKKAIYKEFKDLETILKDVGFKGWVSWTQLINPHIMKFFTKLKAFPYVIDLKKETIWFRKEL